VWQELRAELHPKNVEIITVALDTGGPEAARPWIEAARPGHPALIDAAHVTDALFGFVNVPMSVWIDESGTLVRAAEVAQVRRSPLRDMEVPGEGLPERMHDLLLEVKKIPDQSERYVAGLRDWAELGASSRLALGPDEVVARSRPRSQEVARAAASFELGQHLWRTGDHEAGVGWFREAHRLDPDNWTYKRQAWTLATTTEGQPSDLLQGPTDTYEGDWLTDVRRLGADHYYAPLDM
jgi:hypothetical protein